MDSTSRKRAIWIILLCSVLVQSCAFFVNTASKTDCMPKVHKTQNYGKVLSIMGQHDPHPILVCGMVSENDMSEFGVTKNNKSKLAGILVLLTVPLSWGTYGPVVRYLYAFQPSVPGFVFSACYYALAAVTTTTIAAILRSQNKDDTGSIDSDTYLPTFSFPLAGGIELGSYLFLANCLQVLGLRTVESDRAGFLVQLTTVMVPFVEALFARNLKAVPVMTWFACILAFGGLVIMSIDGKEASLNDPVSSLDIALSSFTGGDCLIIGAAMLYTLHVVRLGTYARATSPIELAAAKATIEAFFSVALVLGLLQASLFSGHDTAGLMGFASENGREISTFFASFSEGLSNGSITDSSLFPAVGAIFWTGWITCAYTIFAQSFGQSRVSPTNANLIYTFQPIFTAMFAYFLLGEKMGLTGFAGGAIIAVAVYIVASTSFEEANLEHHSDTILYEDEPRDTLEDLGEKNQLQEAKNQSVEITNR